MRRLVFALCLLWPLVLHAQERPPVDRDDTGKEMRPPVESPSNIDWEQAYVRYVIGQQTRDGPPPPDRLDTKGPPPHQIEAPPPHTSPPPGPRPRIGGQITVCAVGCTYDNAHLQDALDAARDGDQVLLQSGATYNTPPDEGYIMGTGCKVPVWDCLTVRTGVTSTGTVMPRSAFPPDNIRMDPTLPQCLGGTVSCRGVLAKMVPPSNNAAAIKTVYPGQNWGPGWGGCSTIPCVGNGWTVKWIEFPPRVVWPKYSLVRFGTNKVGKEDWNYAGGCTWPDGSTACWHYALPAGETQDTLVEIPRFLSLIQCDLYGDPVIGQHQGLLLASRDARVIGNSFRDIKTVSPETQAIIATNGPGPWEITNNHLEGSGETFMSGGSDTYLQLYATIAGTPTASSITLASPVWIHMDGTTTPASLATDMYSGIFVGIVHGGHEYSGATCTLSGATCTLSPSLPFTPSVGDVVRWCWIHGGITFRYNHVYKPPSWKNAVLPTPVFSLKASSGSLPSGTYCYRMTAWVLIMADWMKGDNAAEQCLTTSGGVTINWAPMTGVSLYRVYGRVSGASTLIFDVNPPTTTYTDNGTGGAAGPIDNPGISPACTSFNSDMQTAGLGRWACWGVKNNFEFKSAEGGSPAGPILVEYNVFDGAWCCWQNNILSIKTWNQDGGDRSTVVRNLTFRNNWIRHGSRAINMTATGIADNFSYETPSGVMSDVSITNNLWTDISNTWNPTGSGYGGDGLMSYSAGNNQYVVGPKACQRCSFVHNTFLVESNNMKWPVYWTLNSPGDEMVDLVWRDNIMPRTSTDPGNVSDQNYGIQADINGTRQPIGTTSWTTATSGASVADHNAWVEANSGQYTFSTNSSWPTQVQLQSYLVNYAACVADNITACAQTAASPLHLAASDKTDIGADIAVIKTGTDIALNGDLTGGGGTVPPPETPTVGHGGRSRTRLRGGG